MTRHRVAFAELPGRRCVISHRPVRLPILGLPRMCNEKSVKVQEVGIPCSVTKTGADDSRRYHAGTSNRPSAMQARREGMVCRFGADAADLAIAAAGQGAVLGVIMPASKCFCRVQMNQARSSTSATQ